MQRKGGQNPYVFLKMLLYMKLTVIFLVSFMLQASAASYGQVTISKKDESLKNIFNDIREQTGYDFFYNSTLLANAKPVSINVTNASLAQVLEMIFRDQPLTYEIVGKAIVVRKKEPAAAPMPVAAGQVDPYSGYIEDADTHQPLAQANIRVAETGVTVSSNDKGKFTITAEAGQTLVITYIGYGSKSVQLGKEKNLKISLRLQPSALDQIVATGYTTKRSSEVTGSLQKISGEQLNSAVTSPNVLSLLKGIAVGVSVTENAADVTSRPEVFIRGQSTLPANASIGPNSPLIILDGVIIGNVDMQSVVNPDNIESITVLKDAASTAIYGSRAALGVFVITTRHATSGISVSLNSRAGTLNYTSRMPLMNTAEWTSSMDRYLSTQWDELPDIQTAYPQKPDYLSAASLYNETDKAHDFNWSKALYKTGSFYDNTISLSSGNEKNRLYGSVGSYIEKGIQLGDRLNRFTLKLNADFILSSKLTVSFLTTAISERTTQQNALATPDSYLPFYQPTDASGKLTASLPFRSGVLPDQIQTADVPNILYEAKNYDNTAINKTQNYIGTFSLKYRPINSLTFQSSYTAHEMLNDYNSNYDSRSISGRYGDNSNYLFLAPLFPQIGSSPMNGSLTINNNSSTSFLTSNTITYQDQFGLHGVSVLGGMEYGHSTTKATSNSYYNILPGERNAGAASSFGNSDAALFGSPYIPVGSQVDAALFSAFSEATYSYDHKYIVTGSFRTDASPTFGRNNRYGNFYSVSGAWLIKKENFLKNVREVDNLKLRYAYGTSGRDLGGYFLSQTYYSNTSSYNGVNSSGSILSQLANDDIRWETTYNQTLGFEIGLLKRFSLNLDLYNRRSSGLIQSQTLAATLGGFTQSRNIGEIVNKGVEITVQGKILQAKDFVWNISANISLNRNHITKLVADSLLDKLTGEYYRHVGEDINEIKAIPYAGVNPANGAPLFRVYNGAGQLAVTEGISGDALSDPRNYQRIGSATPRYFGGFQSSWTYKNFTLSTDWYFQVGNYVNNLNILAGTDPSYAYSIGANLLKTPSSIRIWQGAGDIKANFPNVFSSNYTSTAAGWNFDSYYNSASYQNASHLRLRNIRLNWDVPSKVLARATIKSLAVYISADNVFVIRKSGFWGKDPEAAYINDPRYTSQPYLGSATTVSNPLRLIAGINLNF